MTKEAEYLLTFCVKIWKQSNELTWVLMQSLSPRLDGDQGLPLNPDLF